MIPVTVQIRDVRDDDLDVFFEHQREPKAVRMAAFPARDRDVFLAHWAKIRADPANVLQAVLVDGRVAGNLGSWEQDGQRLVCYWIGQEYWGQGVATQALGLLLDLVRTRPLYAEVAVHNVGSIRVLEKCGFRLVGGPDEPHSTVGADGIAEVTLVLAADPA